MYVVGLIIVVALIFLVHSIIPTYYNKLLNKEVLKNIIFINIAEKCRSMVE